MDEWQSALGRGKIEVIEILEKCGFEATIGIDVLIDNSLLTIEKENLWMHSLLQEMGRQIVRSESCQQPGKRSRLWHYDDLFHVLAKDTCAAHHSALRSPEISKLENPSQSATHQVLNFRQNPPDLSVRSLQGKSDSLRHTSHNSPQGPQLSSGWPPSQYSFRVFIGGLFFMGRFLMASVPSIKEDRLEFPTFHAVVDLVCIGITIQFNLNFREASIFFWSHGISGVLMLTSREGSLENYLVGESRSWSSNDWHLPLETTDWYLPLEASSVVSNGDIQLSNPPQEFGSPPRLEGQYGCIDLVEIHPSFGPLNRLFVFELQGRYQLHRICLKDLAFSGMSRLVGILLNGMPWLKRLIPYFRQDYYSEIEEIGGGGEGEGGCAVLPCSFRWKEEGFRTAVQIIIPGLEIPWWLTYQSLGNSISIELPPNWFRSKWMGLALCASFNAISSPSYAHEFGNPVKTFGLRARVKVLGDHIDSAFEIFFNVKFGPKHIWLLYLSRQSRDDWFGHFWIVANNSKCSHIEVVFETYSVNVWKCGAALVIRARYG
uniref:Uncharacterized protein n=1 Tax=Fagus sylvatica TaxID=28930 RepID=A0A2N9EFI7_FAGSY